MQDSIKNQDETVVRIIHVDDDPFFLEQLSELFCEVSSEESWIIETFDDANAMLQRIHKQPAVDIALLDINLGQQSWSGLTILEQIKKSHPQLVTIMCSDLNDPDTVHDCLSSGADDFLFKSVDERHIFERIRGAWLRHRRQTHVKGSVKKLPPIPGKTMQDIASRIPDMLQSALTAIHIYGESGSGKELVSELFELHLPKSTPFIRVHCGAIAPNLLESELFGHVKGAFTGAVADKIGLLEQANNGWVFLDEVATLPAAAQIALLRVLETHKLRPVGSNREKAIRIRILSATNEKLEELVQKGSFRLDLWQRLCEATIQLKPLRERMSEFAEIAESLCKDLKPGPFTLMPSTLQLLKAYDWSQGNVRELRNCLRAMTEGCYDGLLTPKSIPERIWDAISAKKLPNSEQIQSQSENGIWLGWQGANTPAYDELCQSLLIKLISYHYTRHGKLSIRGLASRLGLPKSTLATRLQKLAHSELISTLELTKMVNISSDKQKS